MNIPPVLVSEWLVKTKIIKNKYKNINIKYKYKKI